MTRHYSHDIFFSISIGSRYRACAENEKQGEKSKYFVMRCVFPASLQNVVPAQLRQWFQIAVLPE